MARDRKGDLQSQERVGDDEFPGHLGLLMMTGMKRHKVPKILFLEKFSLWTVIL